jgi:hypothetical protein
MTRTPPLAALLDALAAGRIVPVDAGHWRVLAPAFTLVEDIATGLAGRILLVRRDVPGQRRKGWALVEEPGPNERVVRPLPDEAAARALIADRLAAYERMWDG